MDVVMYLRAQARAAARQQARAQARAGAQAQPLPSSMGRIASYPSKHLPDAPAYRQKLNGTPRAKTYCLSCSKWEVQGVVPVEGKLDFGHAPRVRAGSVPPSTSPRLPPLKLPPRAPRAPTRSGPEPVCLDPAPVRAAPRYDAFGVRIRTA